MKNQHFDPSVFLWMLLVSAFIPAVLASQWLNHSMIVFGLVYILVVFIGLYVIFPLTLYEYQSIRNSQEIQRRCRQEIGCFGKDHAC